MIPDNARILRITAAAGTELADAYSQCTLIGCLDNLIAPLQKRFTIHRTYFPHAAWLDQPSGHCPIFLTAASRRSLGRVSVPMWGAILSDPLPIVALVGRCPANWLIGREPIRGHLSAIKSETCDSNCYGVLGGVSTGYPPTTGKLLTRYAPFRRSPTCIATLAAPRLACVKPAASVHPEPGSNSSWYIFLYS